MNTKYVNKATWCLLLAQIICVVINDLVQWTPMQRILNAADQHPLFGVWTSQYLVLITGISSMILPFGVAVIAKRFGYLWCTLLVSLFVSDQVVDEFSKGTYNSRTDKIWDIYGTLILSAIIYIVCQFGRWVYFKLRRPKKIEAEAIAGVDQSGVWPPPPETKAL